MWDEEYYIQKLVDIIPLCRLCHQAIHFNIQVGKYNETEVKEHYLKVNKCDSEVFSQKFEEAKLVYERRSRIRKWELDTSWITKKQWVEKIFYPDEHRLTVYDEEAR